VSELEAYEKAQVREYGTYTAVRQIHIGEALAFNTGDPVPVSHVERGVVSRDDVTTVPLPQAQAPVRHVPFGADAQPDPADVEAAAEANLEAGVE